MKKSGNIKQGSIKSGISKSFNEDFTAPGEWYNNVAIRKMQSNIKLREQTKFKLKNKIKEEN